MNCKFKKNRAHIVALGDILEIILESGREGAIISSVARKAKLSYYSTLEKCENLISAGLVESKADKRNRVFTITEKGVNFIQEYRNFQILIQPLNLKY